MTVSCFLTDLCPGFNYPEFRRLEADTVILLDIDPSSLQPDSRVGGKKPVMDQLVLPLLLLPFTTYNHENLKKLMTHKHRQYIRGLNA